MQRTVLQRSVDTVLQQAVLVDGADRHEQSHQVPLLPLQVGENTPSTPATPAGGGEYPEYP